MSEQETVEVKFHPKFVEAMQKLLRDYPWLAYKNVEEFVEDAAKWRMEQLKYIGMVEVVVKIPKRLMDLVRKQGFFGWETEGDFFTACVILGTDAQASELDFDEMQKLKEEFGEGVTTLYYDEVGNKKVLKL